MLSSLGEDFRRRLAAVQEALRQGLWTELPKGVEPELLEVYVTHLTNDDYVVGAEVLAASLAATGTARPLVALVTDGLSSEGRQCLERAGWLLLEVGLVGHEGATPPSSFIGFMNSFKSKGQIQMWIDIVATVLHPKGWFCKSFIPLDLTCSRS